MAWYLYMPAQLYRPFCEDPYFTERTTFGAAMSEDYRENLRFALITNGVPFFEFGNYVLVPLLAWTDETEFWRKLDATVPSTIGVEQRAHPHIEKLANDVREIFGKMTDWDEQRRRRCAYIEAVVTPLELWHERENLAPFIGALDKKI
jgi:hypothetical protein